MALTKAHNRMIETSVANLRDFGAVGNGTQDSTVKVSVFNGTSSDVVNWTLSYRTNS